MKFATVLLLALTAPFNVFSQFENDYKPLTCSAPIPDDFIGLATDKYKESLETEIDESESLFDRKSKSAFILKSSFWLNEILTSGRVLFNDPISEYVEKVGKIMIGRNKKLKNIRFYTLKSPATNAFATHEGIVFVTTGLISQLENEAQLAFVLGHELAHIEKRHVINRFMEKQKIRRNKGKYKKNNLSDAVNLLSTYSKTSELEADSIAFEKYMKTKYDPAELQGVYDVLSFSYLPFDDVKFDISCLESDQLKFPKSILLDTIAPIEEVEDDDDSRSFHPNILKRREKIDELLSTKANSFGTKQFIVSEQDFIKTRELARFETIKSNLLDAEYGKAIYNAFLLSKQYPNNRFLKYSIAKALYGMTSYQAHDQFDDISTDPETVQGESQALHHVLAKISADQLQVIALEYMLELRKKYPNDKLFEQMKNDLFEGLIIHRELGLADFYDKTLEEARSELKSQIIDTVETKPKNKRLSKYDKIKRKKKLQKRARGTALNNDNFHLYAFSDNMKNEEFLDDFNYWEEVKSDNKKEQKKLGEMSEKKKQQYEYKQENRTKKGQYRLGLNKLIVLDPMYIRFDQRKNSSKLIHSEARRIKLNNQIESVAQVVGLQTNMLCAKNLASDDVEEFNQIAILTEWFNETMQHGEIEMIPLSTEYVQPIAKKIGTYNLGFTGVYSYRLAEAYMHDEVNMLWYYILAQQLIPWGLYKKYFSGFYETFYYSIVLDLRNGETKMVHSFGMNEVDTEYLINSHLYNSLYQIKARTN